MSPSKEQYQGCLVGLALGDALGAPYEGGVLERLLWLLLGRTKDGLPRWTDDTQMTLDVTEVLLSRHTIDQTELARRFAASYRWSRGYGPSTARLLKRIRRGEPWSIAAKAIYKQGSFGNGAAMRASVLALWYHHDVELLVREAMRAAEITHSHPLGMEGAVLIAVATQALLRWQQPEQILATVRSYCRSDSFQIQLDIIHEWLGRPAPVLTTQVAALLGNGMTAQTSCVTALYIAMSHLQADFMDMLAYARACGGDVDTISAMAGTLWGAYHGLDRLPTIAIEQREHIETLGLALHEQVCVLHR